MSMNTLNFIYHDVDAVLIVLQTSGNYCNCNNILSSILSPAVPCKEWQEGESVFCYDNLPATIIGSLFSVWILFFFVCILISCVGKSIFWLVYIFMAILYELFCFDEL